MSDKRPALGKGLSALIPDAAPETRQAAVDIDVDLLAPNDDQPRMQMDAEKLDELARSIRVHGVIQPIVVRRDGVGRYRIIAGERRWRAAQRAGLLKVPVVVRDLDPAAHGDALQLALIENIQREDLNCVDEAAAYQRLAEEFHLTQDAIAAAVGKDRSTVANYLRLLKLPDEVRADLASGALSMGHARAMLTLESASDQRQAAREVISRGLSVRETESMVKKLAAPARARTPPEPASTDVHTKAAEDRLRFTLGTRVRIVRAGAGGRIEIAFTSEAELHRLYEQLTERR